MMQLGVSTGLYEFAGIPLQGAIEHISRFGIHYIDVLAHGTHNPTSMPIKEQLRIAKLMEKHDMRAACVITCPKGNDANYASDDKDEQEFMLQQAKLAGYFVKELGGRLVMLGTGVGHRDYYLPEERAMENSANFMRKFAEWCDKMDLVPIIELEPAQAQVCHNIESTYKYVQMVNMPNVAVNMDICHLHVLRTRPDECAILKDRIIHMHLSDSPGREHSNPVLGEGTANVNWFVEQCHAWNIEKTAASFGEKQAVATLEVGHAANGHLIPDPDHCLVKSLSYLMYNCPSLRDDTGRDIL